MRVTKSGLIFLLVLLSAILLGKIVIRISPQCDSNYIPYDVAALQEILSKNLFGQPLVNEIVYILEGHKKNIDIGGNKALTLSFHGTPGVGKSYVTQFIAKVLFKDGLSSPYAKLYIGKEDFPVQSKVSQYKEKLKTEIKDLVKKCGVALIIFDEVNDIPRGVLSVLKPMMDHHVSVDGVDYRKVLFVFLSNVGGEDIARKFYEMDKPRESVTFKDFNDILKESLGDALDDENEGKLIYADLIDHFIPFLPLEDEHVEKCTHVEFQRQGLGHVSDELIDEVMSTISYMEIDEAETGFIQSGCKKIKMQVSFLLQKIKS